MEAAVVTFDPEIEAVRNIPEGAQADNGRDEADLRSVTSAGVERERDVVNERARTEEGLHGHGGRGEDPTGTIPEPPLPDLVAQTEVDEIHGFFDDDLVLLDRSLDGIVVIPEPHEDRCDVAAEAPFASLEVQHQAHLQAAEDRSRSSGSDESMGPRLTFKGASGSQRYAAAVNRQDSSLVPRNQGFGVTSTALPHQGSAVVAGGGVAGEAELSAAACTATSLPAPVSSARAAGGAAAVVAKANAARASMSSQRMRISICLAIFIYFPTQSGVGHWPLLLAAEYGVLYEARDHRSYHEPETGALAEGVRADDRVLRAGLDFDRDAADRDRLCGEEPDGDGPICSLKDALSL